MHAVLSTPSTTLPLSNVAPVSNVRAVTSANRDFAARLPRVLISDYLCNLRYDSGKFAVGGEKSDRYFYTSEYKTCMRFSFYGTLGNANNFPDYNSCMRMCGSQQ
ncbi:unnamed protein product [Nippostrongylus brasiliensis]|uniref:BPTI/Kunitz inhibitor domain-containing protein n=1 Tax=Nippostrongylus brasiliensis TaxID=27835 RepID=A0A0N4YLL4_NIPBR|nr:unnamed protein product [Nippostrongylus brasiliensis]